MPFVAKPGRHRRQRDRAGLSRWTGPYNAQSARVRDVSKITGPDIYDSGDVTREIYTIRALVRSGNSGGPLVAPNGDVLGVIFAAAADDRNIGFAVTAAEAGPGHRRHPAQPSDHTGECVNDPRAAPAPDGASRGRGAQLGQAPRTRLQRR